MQLIAYFNITRFGIFLLLLTALSSTHAESWIYKHSSKINWREYNTAAFTEAKQSSKPLYLFVYSDLCAWCRKFETETLEKPAIRAFVETHFIPVLIDQQTQPELASQLGIKLVPASMLITHDGKKLLRFYGVIQEQALLEALNKTLAAWSKGEIPDEEFGDTATCCPVPPHAGESKSQPKGGSNE